MQRKSYLGIAILILFTFSFFLYILFFIFGRGDGIHYSKKEKSIKTELSNKLCANIEMHRSDRDSDYYFSVSFNNDNACIYNYGCNLDTTDTFKIIQFFKDMDRVISPILNQFVDTNVLISKTTFDIDCRTEKYRNDYIIKFVLDNGIWEVKRIGKFERTEINTQNTINKIVPF